MGVDTTQELKRIAEQDVGWAELHPGQLEAMQEVMAGRDVLVVMPTGAAKSAISRPSHRMVVLPLRAGD